MKLTKKALSLSFVVVWILTAWHFLSSQIHHFKKEGHVCSKLGQPHFFTLNIHSFLPSPPLGFDVFIKGIIENHVHELLLGRR